MAGDWIKVEHATLDKPEVLRMAEMLGIKRREMLGLLLDFFVWLDRNSCHGLVTHMSRMSLDDVTHTPGFSAVLCDVGWAEINDATGVMTMKNWDRHNGTPAKTRALAKDRKVTQRSRTERDNTVTREEKRRDTSSLRSDVVPPATKRADVLRSPTTEHQSLAISRNLDCMGEWQKYVDWQSASGKHHKDRSAGFRNWLKNAKTPLPAKQGLRVSREDLAAQLCGRSPVRAEVIDIYPEVTHVAA